MIGFNKGTSAWPARAAGVYVVLGLCAFTIGRVKAQEAPPPVPWVAPDDAKKVKNPFPPTPETLADAEPLFTDNCVLCHGEKGMGDGPGRQDHQDQAGKLHRRQDDGRGDGRIAVLENVERARSDAFLERYSVGQGTLGTGGLHSQTYERRRQEVTARRAKKKRGAASARFPPDRSRAPISSLSFT